MTEANRRYQKLIDGMVEDFEAIATGRENQAVLHAVARFLLDATAPGFFEDDPPLEARIDRVASMLRDVMRAESNIERKKR